MLKVEKVFKKKKKKIFFFKNKFKDPFGSKQELSEILEAIPHFIQSNYEKSGNFFKSLLEPLVQQYIV
jgi:hypothetical protein